MHNYWSFLILASLLPTLTTPFAVLTANKIAKNSLELVTDITNSWKSFNRYHTPIGAMGKRERTFFDKIDTIIIILDEMNQNMKDLVKDINMMVHLSKTSPHIFQTDSDWNKMQNYHIFVNDLFQKMARYVRDIEMYEKSTLNTFSRTVLSSDSNSVVNMIRVMHTYTRTPKFMWTLMQQLKAPHSDLLCNQQQSPREIYHSIFKEFVLTYTKAYVTMQVAYMFKKIYGEGNYNREIEDVLEDFKQKTRQLIQTFASTQSSTSRELWRCDPERQVKNETYLEITSLVQGYIINDMNLNSKGSCSDSCENYNYGKKYNCRIDQWCNRQPKPLCPKVVGCRFIADEMTVCRAKNPSEGRRYNHVQFSNGRTFGKKKSCPRNQITHLSTYTQSIFWECSYCFCLCDEGNTRYSDRYINLRSAIADMSNNRVVTGIRFTKHNRIIHLQIQEGKLLPEGQIDMETVRWVPPEDYHITDWNISPQQDFHILTWEQRGIDLVTVMADENHTVTGVRFRKVGTRLELEALITPFNFTTGQLLHYQTASVYKYNPNIGIRHRFGKELKLLQPDIPIKTGQPSTPDKSKAAYVKFTNSDFVKDAAQSTVPFFDAQPVASFAPTPLSGVGLFHKGRSGSGGFIALKIVTYDFNQHLPEYQVRKKL